MNTYSDQQGGKGERSFTIESSSVKVDGGSYKSNTPYSAGMKVARRLFRKAPKSKKILLTIRETTRGSAKKTFTYEAFMKKLSKPKVFTRGGKEVKVETEVSIKAVKKA